ncbi:pyridoxamine 5'-phosphate oxidase family protein [Pengzhenrongella sicca]|uniref:Pyridoxamine 5'-phosphate oxidase family protein n=1 Tax=Pengzhenrongella sicca TaxID=2819238 RepID=A0A8A4ZFN2_9MICO|nr:pyridoxamine 5'-phosphate oxidase family protein [Pengzhenrongella sicca]QTE29733.1 pyridoxamine 5'-phosphate oxidase family protein [Pengzhenrongella sicca]
MSAAGPRTGQQRRADTLALLATPALDAWVGTASVDARGAPRAHLVPLSIAWLGDRVVIAVDRGSRTGRNLAAHAGARLALGPTRDVVVVDAAVGLVVGVGEAPQGLADGFAAQADWDPRTAGGGYVYVVLRPDRVQAWREADELAGRTLMSAGAWLP